MRYTKVVAVLAISALLAPGALVAQTLRSGQVPAEFPPASFTGAQYVDSKGCVFIRAGIDGNTTWVPRVNRQRRQICGQSPSLSGTALAAARPQQAAPAVEQITIEPSAPAPAATAQAAPAPARVQTARPAPVRTVAPPPAPVNTAPVNTAPVRTARVVPAPVEAAPAPAPRPAPTPARTATAPAAPACTGASAISQRYINSGSRFPVRCGPQPIAGVSQAQRAVPAPVIRTAPVAAPVRVQPSVVAQTPVAATRTAATRRPLPTATARVSQNTRVLPRQVFDERLAEQGPATVPEGYRPVWEDDRLNPRRAEQSLRGIAQSRLIWTNTVPRRLVDQSTGRDVTAKVALVYPYTDLATQQRELGHVTLVRRDGQLIKRIQRNRSRARAPAAQTAKPVAAQKAVAPKAAAAPKAAQSGRYVQVGTFGVPANAQATAQRLARAGLPARIGTLTRGGKSYRVVLAGPFADGSTLNQGLRKARALGFGDAFVR